MIRGQWCRATLRPATRTPLRSSRDSDDDDASTSSEEAEVVQKKGGGGVDVGQFMNKKKASLDDYEHFKGADDEEDEVAKKMKEILQLRDALGMDRDVNFLAQQAAKEKEKERLANMTQEERMAEEAASSGDMMAKIRAKQAELAKKKAEMGAEMDQYDKVEEDDDDEEEAPKKEKKAKKEKKKKKSKD